MPQTPHIERHFTASDSVRDVDKPAEAAELATPSPP